MGLRFAKGTTPKEKRKIRNLTRGWAKWFRVKCWVIRYKGMKWIVHDYKGTEPAMPERYYVMPFPCKKATRIYLKGAGNRPFVIFKGPPKQYCPSFVQGCSGCIKEFSKLLGDKARVGTALLVLGGGPVHDWCPLHGKLGHVGMKPLFA